MKFPDSIFDSLPCFHDKIKVSVRKIIKTFGPDSGVTTNLAEIVDDKKYRSPWLTLTLTNFHGIQSSVTTGSWMKKPFRLRRKKVNFIG